MCCHDANGFMDLTDAASNRKLLSMLLKNRGMSVEMAEDGQQAVAIIEKRPFDFDIIFMDYQMPVMVS